MSHAILVSGLINLEVTLRVDGFPIAYAPVHYPFSGIHSTVAGVGYNISKALTTLGDRVRLLSLIGQDAAGRAVRQMLESDGLGGEYVLAQMAQTAHSVILYDPSGRRQIYVDLKDVQEQVYPPHLFEGAVDGCELAVLCNINFSRPFLRRARALGRRVATDVHTIADLEDEYNRDFMQYADILFMSDERLPCPPEEWARAVQRRYGNEIVVIGLGAEGALMAVKKDDYLGRIPAARPPRIVNTIGAGDALFSAFLHCYLKSGDPYAALRRAVVFAAHKIGSAGAAEGFLDEAALENDMR